MLLPPYSLDVKNNMAMARVKFNDNGTVTIVTTNNTKHTFATVSSSVAWCNKNGVDAVVS